MIAVLLVTHGATGKNLLDTLSNMLGELSLPCDTLAIARDDDPDTCIKTAQSLAQKLDQGDGVLLLTDAFGSTPSNIANHAAASANYAVVTGVNLPMLVRIFNYPQLALDDMVASAVEAGRQGIMSCTPSPSA